MHALPLLVASRSFLTDKHHLRCLNRTGEPLKWQLCRGHGAVAACSQTAQCSRLYRAVNPPRLSMKRCGREGAFSPEKVRLERRVSSSRSALSGSGPAAEALPRADHRLWRGWAGWGFNTSDFFLITLTDVLTVGLTCTLESDFCMKIIKATLIRQQ